MLIFKKRWFSWILLQKECMRKSFPHFTFYLILSSSAEHKPSTYPWPLPPTWQDRAEQPRYQEYNRLSSSLNASKLHLFLVKMFNALHHLQILRFAVPATVVLGVVPQYFFTWLTWRCVCIPFPRRVFDRGDDVLYDMYQSLICFFYETCSGAEVV